jgi:hypothetical protein
MLSDIDRIYLKHCKLKIETVLKLTKDKKTQIELINQIKQLLKLISPY